MSDPDHINRDRIERSRVERDRIVETSSNGSMALIVGGLVVAVIVILWLFASGSNWRNVSAPPANEPNVQINQTAPAADPAAPADPAPATPAPDTTTPPADTAPAQPAEPTPAN